MSNLYLKYRPRQLAEVVGQPHIIRSLTKQVEANRLSHAYLLAGHLGAGKTTVGRILATLFNCQNRKGAVVCGKCRPCQLIHGGSSPDVYEIDAASQGGVDAIRDLKERAYYAPQEFAKKVYLIDEAHMLTKEACNALLKVVEEPPKYAAFIFATTDPAKVLPTIRSRCRTCFFQGVPIADIAGRLEAIAAVEQITLETSAAAALARLADGSLRDAIDYFEESAIVSDGKITAALIQEQFGQPDRRVAIELVKQVAEGNATAVLMATDDLMHHGADVNAVLREVSEVFRAALLLEAGASALVYLTAEEKESLQKVTNKLTRTVLINIAKLLGRVDKEIELNINPRMVLEAALLHCIAYVTTDAAKSRLPS